MASKIIIGVMGPGENATPDENEMAYELGQEIARQGWITLTGGRSFGIMDAALKGASEAGGLRWVFYPVTTIKFFRSCAHQNCHKHGKRT